MLRRPLSRSLPSPTLLRDRRSRSRSPPSPSSTFPLRASTEICVSTRCVLVLTRRLAKRTAISTRGALIRSVTRFIVPTSAVVVSVRRVPSVVSRVVFAISYISARMTSYSVFTTRGMDDAPSPVFREISSASTTITVDHFPSETAHGVITRLITG